MPKKAKGGAKAAAKPAAAPEEEQSAPTSPEKEPEEPAAAAPEEVEKEAPAPEPPAKEPEAPEPKAPVPAAPTPVTASPEELAQYDLTAKLAPFLDGHLIFPILAFLQETGMYNKEDITRAEIELLSSTNMIDFALDKYGELDEEAPDELVSKRETVVENLTRTQEAVLPLLQILEDDESVKQIAELSKINDICERFDFTPDKIGTLFKYAKIQFDCGSYALSTLILKHFATFTEKEYDKNILECMWGRIASSILNSEYEEAAKHIRDLSAHLDNTKMTKSELLLQKTWLLHWALWPIFVADTVPNDLLDFFLSEKSLSVIALSCPHLFRYVGACLILHKRLKHLVKESVWIIHNETSVYSDPCTRFLLALLNDLDFEEAQRELQQCQLLCKGDYFLHRHWGEFEENARLQIFEVYCRIHQCINIGMIASRLNMGEEEAELWIVKLIQNAKLDARIDSEKGRVVMCKAPSSVHHQVIEKTKNLSFRSTMLLSNLEKKENERIPTGVRV